MRAKKNIVLFGYENFGRQLYKNLSKIALNIKVLVETDELVTEGINDNINILKINIKKNDDILSLGINENDDLLYCAMDKTSNNLFLVLTLRALLPKANIISISNSSESTRKLVYAGANSVIDLYESTSRRIINMLTKPAVTKALDEIIYTHNDLKIAEVLLPKDSIFEGEYIRDIQFKAMGIILIAIIDEELGHELIFIDHRINHKIDAGDVLVIIGVDDKIKKFKERINTIQ